MLNGDGIVWGAFLSTSAAIAVFHTLGGPDHWLPFIALSRARGWGRWKTLWVTAACGVGHVGSSIVLALLAAWAGTELVPVHLLEEVRGSLAAVLLVGFGLAYAAWGIRVGIRRAHQLEPHVHGNHVHIHRHGLAKHTHEELGSMTTFWTLFIVFVLGPCEPLIPLVMAPAARGQWALAWVTSALFGVVTIATMLLVVALAVAGLEGLSKKVVGGESAVLAFFSRWSHAMAGAVVAACGLAIIYLGL